VAGIELDGVAAFEVLELDDTVEWEVELGVVEDVEGEDFVFLVPEMLEGFEDVVGFVVEVA
jgi:hypothetical protein